MTDHEIDHLAEQFKPVVIPELVPIAEKDGKVIGFGIALPDLNVVFRGNRSGRMFPVVLKLLWALKTQRDPPRRILLLGVLPEYRGKGVDAMLYHWIWTKSARARDLLGRGGLDPGGQPGHERRPREDDLHGLQDLPALRPTDMKALVTGGDRLRRAATSSKRCAAAGDEVTALVALAASKAAALATARRPRGRGRPARSRRRSGQAVEGQDVVYHVAGAGRGAERGRLPGGQSRWHAQPGRGDCACRGQPARAGLLDGGGRPDHQGEAASGRRARRGR